MEAASNLYSFNLTHCDFEDGDLMCGFTQNRDDTYDWQIDSTYPDHTLGSKMGEQLMKWHKKLHCEKKSISLREKGFKIFFFNFRSQFKTLQTRKLHNARNIKTF